MIQTRENLQHAAHNESHEQEVLRCADGVVFKLHPTLYDVVQGAFHKLKNNNLSVTNCGILLVLIAIFKRSHVWHCAWERAVLLHGLHFCSEVLVSLILRMENFHGHFTTIRWHDAKAYVSGEAFTDLQAAVCENTAIRKIGILHLHAPEPRLVQVTVSLYQ